MKITGLTRIEKLKLIGLCIEGATGVIGTSLVLTEKHPYLTITVLALGAIATKTVSFIKERENKAILEAVSSESKTIQDGNEKSDQT